MRTWEFKHKEMEGQTWIIKEMEDNTLKVFLSPFSLHFQDWSLIDEFKAKGKLEFIKEYETTE